MAAWRQGAPRSLPVRAWRSNGWSASVVAVSRRPRAVQASGQTCRNASDRLSHEWFGVLHGDHGASLTGTAAVSPRAVVHAKDPFPPATDSLVAATMPAVPPISSGLPVTIRIRDAPSGTPADAVCEAVRIDATPQASSAAAAHDRVKGPLTRENGLVAAAHSGSRTHEFSSASSVTKV
jgi:hypothetical protein